MNRNKLEKQISEMLDSGGNLLAREIASSLGVTRSQVNSILYNELSGDVIQNEKYQWSKLSPKHVNAALPLPGDLEPVKSGIQKYLIYAKIIAEIGIEVYNQEALVYDARLADFYEESYDEVYDSHTSFQPIIMYGSQASCSV